MAGQSRGNLRPSLRRNDNEQIYQTEVVQHSSVKHGVNTSHLLGFMQGEFTVPDDFDQMGMDEIARLFQAGAITTCGFRFNRDEANKR